MDTPCPGIGRKFYGIIIFAIIVVLIAAGMFFAGNPVIPSNGSAHLPVREELRKPPVIVRIDADRPIYSPMMSSTIGIGLVPNVSGPGVTDARYEWNASYGRFLGWSGPDHLVSEQGTSVVCNGNRIYWSYSAIPSDTSNPVFINLTARDNTTGAVLGRSSLSLDWQQNGTFVHVGRIERIP